MAYDGTGGETALVTAVEMATPVVDMGAHNGLRGVLALWIMLFHCVLYSKLHEHIDTDRPPINLMGSALMPPFFVLSGFSLVVCHGATLTPDGRLFTAEWWAGWRRFMQNRAARILPVFYLVTACAVPLTFLGHGWVNNDTFSIVSRVITNVLVIHMWTPVAFGFCGPAWTVSTLWFFYIVFPMWLPWLQRVCSHPNRYKQVGGLTLWALAPICKPCTGNYNFLLEQTSNKHQLSSSTNRMQSLWRLLAHLYVAQWIHAIIFSLFGFTLLGGGRRRILVLPRNLLVKNAGIYIGHGRRFVLCAFPTKLHRRPRIRSNSGSAMDWLCHSRWIIPDTSQTIKEP